MQFLQPIEPPLILQMADALALFVSTIIKTRPIPRLTLGVSSINHTLIGAWLGVGVGEVMGQVMGQVTVEGGISEKRQAAQITY